MDGCRGEPTKPQSPRQPVRPGDYHQLVLRLRCCVSCSSQDYSHFDAFVTVARNTPSSASSAVVSCGLR